MKDLTTSWDFNFCKNLSRQDIFWKIIVNSDTLWEIIYAYFYLEAKLS